MSSATSLKCQRSVIMVEYPLTATQSNFYKYIQYQFPDLGFSVAFPLPFRVRAGFLSSNSNNSAAPYFRLKAFSQDRGCRVVITIDKRITQETEEELQMSEKQGHSYTKNGTTAYRFYPKVNDRDHDLEKVVRNARLYICYVRSAKGKESEAVRILSTFKTFVLSHLPDAVDTDSIQPPKNQLNCGVNTSLALSSSLTQTSSGSPKSSSFASLVDIDFGKLPSDKPNTDGRVLLTPLHRQGASQKTLRMPHPVKHLLLTPSCFQSTSQALQTTMKSSSTTFNVSSSTQSNSSITSTTQNVTTTTTSSANTTLNSSSSGNQNSFTSTGLQQTPSATGLNWARHYIKPPCDIIYEVFPGGSAGVYSQEAGGANYHTVIHTYPEGEKCSVHLCTFLSLIIDRADILKKTIVSHVQDVEKEITGEIQFKEEDVYLGEEGVTIEYGYQTSKYTVFGNAYIVVKEVFSNGKLYQIARFEAHALTPSASSSTSLFKSGHYFGRSAKLLAPPLLWNKPGAKEREGIYEFKE